MTWDDTEPKNRGEVSLNPKEKFKIRLVAGYGLFLVSLLILLLVFSLMFRARVKEIEKEASTPKVEQGVALKEGVSKTNGLPSLSDIEAKAPAEDFLVTKEFQKAYGEGSSNLEGLTELLETLGGSFEVAPSPLANNDGGVSYASKHWVLTFNHELRLVGFGTNASGELERQLSSLVPESKGVSSLDALGFKASSVSTGSWSYYHLRDLTFEEKEGVFR